VPVVAQMSGSQYMGGGVAGSSSGGHPKLCFRPTRGLSTLQGKISTDPKQAACHFWPDLRQVSEQHQSKSNFFVQFCAFGWWS